MRYFYFPNAFLLVPSIDGESEIKQIISEMFGKGSLLMAEVEVDLAQRLEVKEIEMFLSKSNRPPSPGPPYEHFTSHINV